MTSKHKDARPQNHNEPTKGGGWSNKDLVTVAFSALALLISAAVAYFSALSPPDIRVSVSAPIWTMPSDASGNKRLAMNLICAFSNHGARNGVVEDVMLRLESLDDSTKWLFYPGPQVDETKFLSSDSPVPPTAVKGLISTFYPVSVPGKQSQQSTYLFLPMLKHPSFPFQGPRPHKFRVTVLTRANGEQEFRSQQTFTVDLPQSTLDFIQTGANLQQFPEEFDQARRDIN